MGVGGGEGAALPNCTLNDPQKFAIVCLTARHGDDMTLLSIASMDGLK